MAKHLLPLLCFLAACSPITRSTNQCADDAGCDESPAIACRSDETMPCGPPAVGVCHPGIFHCVDGVFDTTCSGAVTGTAELCNGLDDDCDGTVDNGVITTFYVDLDGDGFGSSATGAETRQACTKPSGFADNASDCDDTNGSRKPTAQELCDPSEVDENCDGVANEGCGCSNPGMTQACCAGRGAQTCEAVDGGAILSMCSVQPSLELCNGIDDDCDGLTDELFSVASPDGGVPTLDAGTILSDGGCTVGIGACARTAGIACAQGSLMCLAVAGTPGAELCNSIDDDCDGQTDEASPGLCPAAGQSCSAGACACPSGQTVCGASCESLGGSCSNGVGACARSGSIACVSGGPGCDAVPGTPSPEICDSIDNDCDGQTDEGLQIQCWPDRDNDRYPGSTAAFSLCPDPTRTTFGNCPSGYVASAAALGGVDCDDTSAAVFRVASIRSDGDLDGYCVGAAVSQCIGTNPPSGWMLSTSCLGDDCAAGDAAKYRVLSVMADADGDNVCAGATVQQCTGQNPQPGFRLATDCAPFGGSPPIDCNDANANEWQLLSVRADADGDTWCSGTAFSQCTNNAPKPGYRPQTQCVGDDCRDSNPNATSTCSIPVSSQQRIKACGIGIPATQPLSFDWQCPVGFQALNSLFFLDDTPPRITDPARGNPPVIGSSGTTSMNFTCQSGVIGEDVWRLQVTCGAL